MSRKIAFAALAACLMFGSAQAGTHKDTGAAGAAAMKAEMAKCSVCKAMVTNFDEIMPVMKTDVANLNNGVAIMHTITDPSKVEMFHASCEGMEKAGAATMAMTDAQAKTGLCSFCQEMRSAMKAGAKMSTGKTKSGGIMVLTSDDPKVQAQIASLGEKCAMMSAAN